MNEKKIGQLLKDEREKQNLSLKEISSRTKIYLSKLKAIEDGNFEILKVNIFTIGFIKNYAKELKIDERKINQLCQHLIEENSKKREVEVISKQKKESEKPGWYQFFRSHYKTISATFIVFTLTILIIQSFKTTKTYQKKLQKKTPLNLKSSPPEFINTFTYLKDGSKFQSKDIPIMLENSGFYREKKTEASKAKSRKINKKTDKQKKVKKFSFESNNRLEMKALQKVEVEIVWSNGFRQKFSLKKTESKTLVFSSPIQLKINHGQRLMLSLNKNKEHKSGHTDEPVQINYP